MPPRFLDLEWRYEDGHSRVEENPSGHIEVGNDLLVEFMMIF
jgi:hypothetical protein